MNLREAVKVALDYLEEHHYEDRGYDYNECPACGWNTREDIPRNPAPDYGWGPPPYHRPNCELLASLTILRELRDAKAEACE